ncbi:MAG: rubrerythrin family protein [Deltaproteobacteria bacterium]|nr:rubrerythrin family protein [Deltaproteobacteria bacterium]MBW1871158.1 rubrerythrin family protein [Deltaproteobacteria bacterium]
MTASKSEENLKTAFIGESKACLRLLGYAEKAEQEGYSQMARLFRAISAAEKVHALKHLRLLKVIKSTEENLKTSFESEISVSENIYPGFIQVAEEEGNKAALISFSHARDAEEVHAKLYKNAIDHMIEERETSYHVCQVCGYVVDGQPPDNCPVCNAPRDKFIQVD